LAAIDYPDRSSALSAEYAVKQFSPAEKRAYALLLSLCGATAE
jgi:predicted GIY-YIG superfamily endonuclease